METTYDSETRHLSFHFTFHIDLGPAQANGDVPQASARSRASQNYGGSDGQSGGGTKSDGSMPGNALGNKT